MKDFEEMKEWYDGYHFGNADIYCPWDVINYIDDLMSDSKAKPKREHERKENEKAAEKVTVTKKSK